MNRSTAARLLGGAAMLTGAMGWFVAGPATSASAADVNFTAAATAPIMQITEDEPTAQFHPEGEGDYGYTLVTANPSAANAIASLLWPGSAAGNAGTLVEVLGGPSNASALNDPVQASAASGTSQTHSSVTAPTGSAMTASVDPTGPSNEHATATTALAGGALGPAGSVGHSSSTSTIDFGSDTTVLSVTAANSASNVDVGGVVHIGSVTSSASAKATNGGTPQMSGATSFHDMTVAGEEAYVDGSGVHLGAPGAPAGPAAVDSVDTALAASGMEVYFTAPHTITVGGTSYYYAASVLFYWAPPGDPSNNSFTMSLGGSAVSVTDSAQPGDALFGLGGDTSGSDTTAAVPPGTSAQVAASGANASGSAPAVSGVGGSGGVAPALASVGGPAATTGEQTLSLPASPASAASRTTGGGEASPLAASIRLPGGVGAWWWVLAGLAALLGAALTTRVPGLLHRQAATACPRTGRSASTFGNGRRVP